MNNFLFDMFTSSLATRKQLEVRYGTQSTVSSPGFMDRTTRRTFKIVPRCYQLPRLCMFSPDATVDEPSPNTAPSDSCVKTILRRGKAARHGNGPTPHMKYIQAPKDNTSVDLQDKI